MREYFLAFNRVDNQGVVAPLLVWLAPDGVVPRGYVITPPNSGFDDPHPNDGSYDHNIVDDGGGEYDECEFDDELEDELEREDVDGAIRLLFADPGGNSALRAATPTNPRNLPCPACREPNRLTPADRAAGYQCDACARAAEGGGY